MKTTFTVAAIGLLAAGALCATAAPASAQEEDLIVVKVPFDFRVGSTQLSAGSYVVKQAGEEPDVLAIESRDGRHVALTLTIPAAFDGKEPAQPELIFQKRDNQYVLARVVEADGNERELLPTHAHGDHETTVAASAADRP